jgi:DNA invertase Pin-like site-specific DNA recombinase
LASTGILSAGNEPPSRPSKRADFEIADGDCDAAVSGADPIEDREGFARLLDRIERNGVRTVIVEDASRFARDLVVQELGIALLAKRGVPLLAASGDDLTNSNDLGRKMMRQVTGAFMEYEKRRLVAKLRGARERKRNETGKKVGGRKSHASYGRRWSRKRAAFEGRMARLGGLATEKSAPG